MTMLFHKKGGSVMHKYQWDKQELERLYNNENMTIRGIAKRYGCMDKTVSEALRRLGIPTRRPGDDKRCNAKPVTL